MLNCCLFLLFSILKHHFSSSESEIISLNNGKTMCHFTPGNFNKDELIPNE